MVDSTRKIVEEFVYCLFRGDKVMPVLYFLPPSPPCRAVMMLGRMINVNFELKSVNVLEKEQLKPEFVEVSVLFVFFFSRFIQIFLGKW